MLSVPIELSRYRQVIFSNFLKWNGVFELNSPRNIRQKSPQIYIRQKALDDECFCLAGLSLGIFTTKHLLIISFINITIYCVLIVKDY